MVDYSKWKDIEVKKQFAFVYTVGSALSQINIE